MRLIAYYTTLHNGRPYEREKADRMLERYERYDVTKIEVGQSYTRVWLEGFGQDLGDGFNSVFFEFFSGDDGRGLDVPQDLERPAIIGLFDVSELRVRRLNEPEWAAAKVLDE